MNPPAPVTTTLRRRAEVIIMFPPMTHVSRSMRRPCVQSMLGGSCPPDDRGDRARQDGAVQHERPMVDVVQIELDPLIEAESAATTDLPEPGQTRADAESAHVR